jgi:hypothetical protein
MALRSRCVMSVYQLLHTLYFISYKGSSHDLKHITRYPNALSPFYLLMFLDYEQNLLDEMTEGKNSFAGCPHQR